MEIDERRVEAAAIFLDDKDHIVHKVTRSGFTTSFVIAAKRSGKRVLLVAPTKKIAGDTMKDAAEEIIGIYGNSACKYNKDEISVYPILKHLPLSIPKNCDECKIADNCCILDIERNPDAPMKSITAAKLEAIMLSDSERAQELRAILEDTDTVLFDESHLLVVNDVPKVPSSVNMLDVESRISDFPTMRSALSKWNEMRYDVEPESDDLWRQADHDPDSYYIREIQVPCQLSDIERRGIWGELRRLAKKHEELGITEEQVLQLRDIAVILCSDRARLSYITEDGQGRIYICGRHGRMATALHDFLKNHAKNAAVVFVSGTQFEPYADFFSSITDREFLAGYKLPITQSVFPDFLDTNSKLTIYTDTFRLSGNTQQKFSRLPDIIERIKSISKGKNNAPIHVIAPNVALHERLYSLLHKEYPNLFFDYYRSENTIGVESEYRIIIAIGLAEVPKNSYDCLADSYTESQTIRVGSVDAATWQAWSRAKDPDGKVTSEVHCIGVKVDDVARVITWGPGRKVIELGTNRYRIECDEELPKPTIMAPYKFQVHKEQRKSLPYIGRVWDASGDLSGLPDSLTIYELENPCRNFPKSTYNNIRGFGENSASNSEKISCFGAIYLNPRNQEEFQITSDTLDRFFRSNPLKHAEQQKLPDKEGHYPYYPHNTADWDNLVMDMLCGIRTPATYAMGESGMTVQCAFDFDNHKGTNPALPRVMAAKKHIEELGLQPIVVASGSPDSYHIHIPVLRTPIKTSHDFMDTMLNELKKSNSDLNWNDSEVFPKQKNKRRTLGNPLKLPLALNNKTGKRAEPLGEDLQPVEVVFITRVVELQDPVEVAEKVGERMYLPVREPTPRRTSAPRSDSSSMRPCILSALNAQLNGSEGNDMRVAVVCEALHAGKTRSEIIKMFESQADFDETITAKHVDYILSQNYRPWRCETLQKKCFGLIDCSRCPLIQIAEVPGEVTVEPILVR